jgi:hypothetical protein
MWVSLSRPNGQRGMRPKEHRTGEEIIRIAYVLSTVIISAN